MAVTSHNEPDDVNTEDGAQQEAGDVTEILERLNLAAVNNKAFSISDETQELLRKFKLIFKDLVNGVPTAYHDLEMLLTNGNRQLQKTYTQLPGFLQKLIKKLPERWTESFAPEILAAASNRAGRSGINLDNVGKAAAAANKMGIDVPSLKEIVGKPAALIGMLRSIMTFLKTRFPAVIGMNVLWSLALFSTFSSSPRSICCTQYLLYMLTHDRQFSFLSCGTVTSAAATSASRTNVWSLRRKSQK